MYAALKNTHLLAIAISLVLFGYRAMLMIAGSARLRSRIWRTVPHIVDTVLLASGVGLIVFWQGAPLTQLWLQVKLVLVFAYIASGSVALHYGRTLLVRQLALAVALGIFLLIVLTARTRLLPWSL